jgi:ElaB protein
MNNSELSESRDKLISELKTLSKDAEDLLQTASEGAGAGYESARERMKSKWLGAKENWGTTQERLVSGSKDAMENADRYVQENPWQAIGMGAAAGLLIGLLLGRK